jgi:hypothetical protein
LKEIRWRQWGREAFDEARRQDKPVVLAISAVWCHWCHVMDQTSYSAPQVIDYINENFIPVRVDNDQHPDINERYNMGGWPSAAFLTPEGYILQGCTYLPTEQFLALAKQTKELYDTNRADIDKIVQPVENSPAAEEKGLAEKPEEFYSKVIKDAVTSLGVMYDPVYGGFGWQPKFPNVDFTRFLMLHHHISGDENSIRMARNTLDQMGRGGVYDKVEDGFFRYSTTPDWSVPHYEKMLADNSELLALYCDLYLITRDEAFRQKAHGIARYMMDKLYDSSEGGFRGSQDADEEYYALGLEERQKRKAPSIDQRKFTDWNGLAVVGMLKAAAITGDVAPEEAATKTLTYLKANVIDSTLDVRHAAGLKGKGHLRDHANLVAAFLAAHELSGDTRHLGDCVMLAQSLMTRFWDKEMGGFFDVAEDAGAIGYLKYRLKSTRDNAKIAELLVKLHLATEDDAYGFIAMHTLQALYNQNKEFTTETPAYASAAMIMMQPHFALRIAGRLGEEPSRRFLRAAANLYEPRLTVRFIDVTKERTQREKLGMAENDAPAAFLCDATACRARIPEPGEISGAVERVIRSVKIKT